MEIKRFFADATDISEDKVRIKGDEFYHATKVLRHKKGFKIIVCAGDTLDRLCTIEKIEKDFLIAKIDSIFQNKSVPKTRVDMFFCLPKSGKLETVIQKATELGLYSVTPVISERSEKTSPDLARLRRIALEASKQCGRAELLAVNPIIAIEEAIQNASGADLALMLYEKEDVISISTTNVAGAKSVSLLIGAEGGFSETEAEKARAAGLKTVSLGRRILRTETAGIVSAAIVMFMSGEFDV